MDKTIIEELGLDDGLIVYDAKRLQKVLNCGRKQAYEIYEKCRIYVNQV